MFYYDFPDPSQAQDSGLLALGGDLSPLTLVNAYTKGIFPWPISDEYPLAWFSPDPRGILQHEFLNINKTLLKNIKKSTFRFSANQAFSEVIEQCALAKNRKGQQGTWITQEIKKGYQDLYEKNLAFSIETWNERHELVGGLYGVCIGSYISGESMFYKESYASKLALVVLMKEIHRFNIDWIDTQICTDSIKALGGEEIERDIFLKKLSKVTKKKRPPGLFKDLTTKNGIDIKDLFSLK